VCVCVCVFNSAMSRLESLFLADNRLTGALPLDLSSITRMDTMDVSGNQLSTTLPAEYRRVTSLFTFHGHTRCIVVLLCVCKHPP
jgi:hypothetical protein